jgi:hypothetical protein
MNDLQRAPERTARWSANSGSPPQDIDCFTTGNHLPGLFMIADCESRGGYRRLGSVRGGTRLTRHLKDRDRRIGF